jgi:hypothetical protein
VRRGRIPEDAGFLLDPARGYTFSIAPATAAKLKRAHRSLVERGAVEEAVATSLDLLRGNSDLAPATVLAAQADLVRGEYQRVFDSIRPVLDRLPQFDAANMVFGRAAEMLGLFPDALVAYGSLREASSLAARRFDAVRPRAIIILADRVDEALDKRRLDAARMNLAILRRWAPRAIETLRSSVSVAAAQDDPIGELDALRQLTSLGAVGEDLMLRRARLELEVGDAGTGLRVIQDLAAAEPDSPRLSAELARAKFLWRLELLPEKVQKLAREPELRRGDLAAMLYWLFPSVRYGQPESGKIANDVLNHPHRKEIVRVANLGIMSVDPRLHHFEPNRTMTRAATMVPILRVLAFQRPQPSCLSGSDVSALMSAPLACELGLRCGLFEEEGECLPEAVASGGVALEWTRRALDQLGVE